MAFSLERKRRRKNMGQSQNQMPDKNEQFVLGHTANLLIRHLDPYPSLRSAGNGEDQFCGWGCPGNGPFSLWDRAGRSQHHL